MCVVAPAAPAKDFSAIDRIIQDAIAQKQIPGAVVLVGHKGKVVYKKAFGQRALEPTAEPMTVDTIFDAASLTKPVATATSVMKLLEEGKFRLNDPVARYIPEFGQNGKEEITIRQLLVHYAGLRPDVDLDTPWTGKAEALRRGYVERPAAPPGARFIYSDINYFILGDLIERVSGKPLDQYAQENVFAPLKMRHTRFNPPPEWRARIAPTEYDENKAMLRGVVHDPTSRRMGGVAGHAGMFTTAEDLSRYAQAVLDGESFVVSRLALQKMTTPQQPPNAVAMRGFGWDIDTPFSSNRGELLPVGSFGHTGFTGTSLWIDPYTRTYLIIMSNAVHPRGDARGAPKVALRTKVANAVAAALDEKLKDEDLRRIAAITGYNEAAAGSRRLAVRNSPVLTGIDVLEAEGFKSIAGTPEAPRPVALVTNHSGLDRTGRRTIDLLANAPGVKLAAIFAPEHGVLGALDTTDIGHTKDVATGITVYSVYGATPESRRPAAEMLAGVDAILFDIQDVGARFYTYQTTLGYFLEAAARHGKELIVLDRPNPINGAYVQGALSDPDKESFVNYHSVPVRHGMTMGELAQFYNAERKINARLRVVAMQGWQRGDWFDSTNLTWINPSPNLRSITQATLYPGVCLIEGTNVSVGRGTDTPFEVIGAPWIKGRQLAEYLNQRQIAGVRFVPVQFTPASSKYQGQRVEGVNIVLLDRGVLDAPHLGIELASALRELYPADFDIQKMRTLLVNQAVLDALVAGDDPRRITESDYWLTPLADFQAKRQPFLLYK